MEFPRRRECETHWALQRWCYQHAAGCVELPPVLWRFNQNWHIVLLCFWWRRFRNAGEENYWMTEKVKRFWDMGVNMTNRDRIWGTPLYFLDPDLCLCRFSNLRETLVANWKCYQHFCDLIILPCWVLLPGGKWAWYHFKTMSKLL